MYVIRPATATVATVNAAPIGFAAMNAVNPAKAPLSPVIAPRMAKIREGIGASPIRAARLNRVTAVAPRLNGVCMAVAIVAKVLTIWLPAPTTPMIPARISLNATIAATTLPRLITSSWFFANH